MINISAKTSMLPIDTSIAPATREIRLTIGLKRENNINGKTKSCNVPYLGFENTSLCLNKVWNVPVPHLSLCLYSAFQLDGTSVYALPAALELTDPFDFNNLIVISKSSVTVSIS